MRPYREKTLELFLHKYALFYLKQKQNTIHKFGCASQLLLQRLSRYELQAFIFTCQHVFHTLINNNKQKSKDGNRGRLYLLFLTACKYPQ